MVGKMNKIGRFSCSTDWVNVTHWMELPSEPKQLKPILELSEDDAIQIAKAATNIESWEIDIVKDTGFYLSHDEYYHFSILFNGEMGFESEDCSCNYNPAKAIDKARELGYNI